MFVALPSGSAGDGLGQHRVAEAVDRVGELGQDRRVDARCSRSRPNRLTIGCTLRANSSNTRCWYCISVTNRAAWKIRSPFHTEWPDAADGGRVPSAWLR